MRQKPIIERLAGIGFVATGGVLEYAALRAAPPQLPAGFVVPQGETAGESRLVGAVDQRVVEEFAVMLLLAPVARRDGAVSDQLQNLLDATIGRIVGWTHPDASGPTLYAGGSLAGVDASVVVWAVRFRSPYHIRKVG